MWSSRPLADAPPFISGSLIWGRKISFTSLTLDGPAVISTGKGAMFAHSRFRIRATSAEPGRSSTGVQRGSMGRRSGNCVGQASTAARIRSRVVAMPVASSSSCPVAPPMNGPKNLVSSVYAGSTRRPVTRVPVEVGSSS